MEFISQHSLIQVPPSSTSCHGTKSKI